MDKKLGALTAAAAVAGAGAAVALAKKASGGRKTVEDTGPEAHTSASYRNTELGKHEKNRKGIYYTNGNYEAFARPEKPEGVENKSAYIVGSGLAALAAACFLVRDGQMPGDHIHILEAMDVAGGACDGIFDPSRGYVMRGGREMEDHFECLWDLFRSIPSLEKPGASVLDEFYWLNKHDPNYSLCRATVDRGRDAHTDGKFNLSQRGCMEIVKLFMTPDEDLYDKTIEDVFDDEVFSSTFWLYSSLFGSSRLPSSSSRASRIMRTPRRKPRMKFSRAMVLPISFSALMSRSSNVFSLSSSRAVSFSSHSADCSIAFFRAVPDLTI